METDPPPPRTVDYARKEPNYKWELSHAADWSLWLGLFSRTVPLFGLAFSGMVDAPFIPRTWRGEGLGYLTEFVVKCIMCLSFMAGVTSFVCGIVGLVIVGASMGTKYGYARAIIGMVSSAVAPFFWYYAWIQWIF